MQIFTAVPSVRKYNFRRWAAVDCVKHETVGVDNSSKKEMSPFVQLSRSLFGFYMLQSHLLQRRRLFLPQK